MNTATSLHSPDGQAWFAGAVGLPTCLQLLSHFVTQDHPTYCGPASAVMALNALGAEPPELVTHPGHRLFTQDVIFRGADRGGAERVEVEQRGATLTEFAAWFEVWGVEAEAAFSGGSSLDDARGRIVGSFRGETGVAVANYHRPGVGQAGGGHFSPIGAFHEATDQVLILDVARYRYPPVWVPVGVLHEAMAEADQGSDQPRGLVVLKLKSEG